MNSEELEHFIRRGYVVLKPDLPASYHKDLYNKVTAKFAELSDYGEKIGDGVLEDMPELDDIFSSPPVAAGIEAVLGKEYVMHSHRHLHKSGTFDQSWHQDSYWGFRRPRHHRPHWCMIMYYPQDTTVEMGPTHVIAGSQFWSLNSWGKYCGEDILEPHQGSIMCKKMPLEERDQGLDEGHKFLVGEQTKEFYDLGVDVPAGSALLIHYDLFHRASRRLSDDVPERYMFKFQFMRLSEPTPGEMASTPQPKTDLPMYPELEPVWEDIRSWLRGEAGKYDRVDLGASSAEAIEALQSKSEIVRIGAAYRLGRSTSWQELVPILKSADGPNEASARAASFGLVATGSEAMDPVVDVLKADTPMPRAYAAFVLGEVAKPTVGIVKEFRAALDRETEHLAKVYILEGLTIFAARARSLKLEDVCVECINAVAEFLVLPPLEHIPSMYQATYPIPPLVEIASQVVFFAGGPRTKEVTELVEGIAGLRQFQQHILFLSYLAYFAEGALRLKGSGKGSGKGESAGYEAGQQPPAAPVSA